MVKTPVPEKVLHSRGRLPGDRPQFDSPLDISSRFCGDQNLLFFTGSQTISICDPMTKTGYLRHTVMLSGPEPSGFCAQIAVAREKKKNSTLKT